jgi:hypothetical protein
MVAAVSACSSIPDDGPVESGPDLAPGLSQAPFDFEPAGPAPNASPTEVVDGFLESLLASPVSTDVSEQFLTPQAQSAWRPDQRTVVYTDAGFTPAGRRVRVSLDVYVELDRQGRWLVPTMGRARSFALRLVRVDGQWRIANPPDATVVPEQHFDLRYRRFALAFFDPSARLLVPEPVYLPWGVQAPSQLVERLLQGPPRDLRQVERTFFPRGTAVDISVPVEDGTARVPLTAQVLDLERDDRERAVAQLAYTLGQVPGVRRMRVTVDGDPLDLPGSDAVDVDQPSPSDPAVPTASTSLFALRGDTVVELADSQELPLGEPVPGTPTDSFAVDMGGSRVAAVVGGGSAVVVARLREDDPGTRTVLAGTDPVRPSWDGLGWLWLLDRTRSGARILVDTGGTLAGPRPLAAPGLAGADVLAFRVSRDGSRLAALVDDPSGGAEVLVARVARDSSGRPRALQPALPLPTGPLPGAVDLAWSSPVTLEVLTRPAAATSRVEIRAADGATLEQPGVAPVPQAGVALTALPDGRSTVVATPAGVLLGLDSRGTWVASPADRGLTAPTYVG